MNSYYNYCKENALLLELYVQPSSSRNLVVGMHGGRLKIKITASPVEGKANKCLIRFLADIFGAHKDNVKIIRGNSIKYKSVLILDPKKIESLQNYCKDILVD